MTENTTTDFFDNIGGGAGAPTALLKSPGDFVHGEVVDMFKRDYVPFGKTEPEKKEDGTNKQQLVVIVQTDSRNWANVVKVPKADPNDVNSPEKAPAEDDGKRAIYVPEKSNIQFAIGRAVTAAKAAFEVGGTLGVKIDKLTDTGKGNPLKEHVAVYQGKPAGGDFFNQAAQAPAAAPAAAPAPAPVAQAAPPAVAPAAATPAPAAAPAPVASVPAQVDPWSGQAAAPTSQPPF